MNTILYFTTPSAAILFSFEFSRQISGGQWENARPYNHWEWVIDVEYKIDDEHIPGYTGYYHRKKYNIKPWFNLHKKIGYKWADRIYKYAKYASILSEDELKLALDNDYLRSVIAVLSENKLFLFETFMERFNENTKEKVKNVFTEDLYNKYYESDYSWKDLKKDLYSCNETINNYINKNE